MMPGSKIRNLCLLPPGALLFAFALICTFPLAAQAPVRLLPGWDHLEVGRGMDVLADPGGTLSLGEVRAAAPERWKRSQSDVLNFAFDTSVYWLRLQIENPLTDQHLFFEVAQPMADYLDIHIVAENRPVIMFHTGDRLPFSTRPIPHRYFLFPLEIQAGDSIQIYVRTATYDGLHDPLPISLWQPSAFVLSDFHRTAPMSGLLLVYAVLALYHFVIFFSLRDRAYIFFAGALAGASMCLAMLWGFVQLLVLGNFPHLANWLFAFTLLVSETLLLVYARYFLEIRRIAPRMDRVVILSGILFWIVALPVFATNSYSLANLWTLIIRFGNTLLLLSAAVLVYSRGHRAARFFLLAFGALGIGVGVRAMHQIGVMNQDLLSNAAFYGGFLLNILLLALGLADRINLLREEKENATRESAENLARQNEQLREMDQLKDEFLANTSHEIRTPLHGIIGITESMLQASPSTITEEMAHNLSLVARSGRRLSRLVDDILDFSKLQHGDLALDRRAVQVQSVVDVVIELSKPLVAGRPIHLTADVSPGLPDVYADEDRLQQILYNLIGNAIKFTKEGVIIVSARSLPDEGASGAVEITVADTGIGIPLERQDAIFESFTQADGSIAREYGGTGLGLAVTKNLVELHGGKIRVDSETSAGTRMIFTIPTARPGDLAVDGSSGAIPLTVRRGRAQHSAALQGDPAATPRAAGMATGTEGPGGPSTSLRHALIVDDDPVNLQVLRNHLALERIQTTSAHNGREALNLLEGQQFDLVLLDVMMPGLTGYDVCRIIREHHSHSELPVIMLTAKNRLNDLEAALEHGANDYLSKPFEARELRARVRTMLTLRDAARTQSEFSALRTEIELARRIQQSLIPEHPPEVLGLHVAAHYRAMQSVGGDFYDFRAGHDKLAVLMADVSGHGVPAALIVSMVHLAFWFQKENLESPEIIFGRMNEILYGNTGNEFVTACYLHFDVAARTLVVGNAGHPPLLLWRRKTQELLKIRPFGRILGLLPDPTYQTDRIELEEGDRILIYTDGAMEAPDANEEIFGEARLAAALRENQDKDPARFVEDLIQTLLDWSGGPEKIDDDIALVAVDFLGGRDPALSENHARASRPGPDTGGEGKEK